MLKMAFELDLGEHRNGMKKMGIPDRVELGKVPAKNNREGTRKGWLESGVGTWKGH